MSQVEPARSMSHRKPVPKFIPSPPPSPPSSPGAPFRQISLASISSPPPVPSSDRPPLPDDWKDKIDRMVSRERRSTLPTINTVVDFSSHEGPSTDLDGDAEPLRQSPASTEFEASRTHTFSPPSPSESYDGDPLSRPHSPTPWMRPGGKRKPQTEYRPPTPPLPRGPLSRQKSRSAESASQGDSPVAITHISRYSPPLPSPPLPTPPLPSPPLPPPPLPTPPRISRPLPEIPVQAQDPPVLETREVKPMVPLVRPEATRPFGPRKLPTPPIPPNGTGHNRMPSHTSTGASSCTQTRTTPSSLVHSEKWPENATRTAGGYEVPIRLEPPIMRETSLEHPRINLKYEASQPIISQNSKPRSLHRALAQGLQRVGSLLVTVFMCR